MSDAASGGAFLLAGIIVTKLFDWFVARTQAVTKAPVDGMASAADLQEAVNAATKETLAGFRQEVSDLRRRVEELEGENRQKAQVIQSLEALLKANGVDLKAATAPGAVLIIDKDHAEILPRPPRPVRGRARAPPGS